MFYADASGNVRLTICEEGCGHLGVGNVAVALTQEEMCDLLYLFRNAIDDIATESGVNQSEPAEGVKPMQPQLRLVRD